MNRVQMFLSCVPPTTNHHAKKIVRIGKFSRLADKPELVAAKETLDTLLLPHQVVTPLAPPYELRLEFTWPWLKGHSKKFRAAGRQPHTSKPDCDNSSKSITDRLVKLLFIEDDKAVVDLHVTKWWGDTPGIAIEIRSLATEVRVSAASTIEPPAPMVDARFHF